jgi:hypothetical protein
MAIPLSDAWRLQSLGDGHLEGTCRLCNSEGSLFADRVVMDRCDCSSCSGCAAFAFIRGPLARGGASLTEMAIKNEYACPVCGLVGPFTRRMQRSVSVDGRSLSIVHQSVLSQHLLPLPEKQGPWLEPSDDVSCVSATSRVSPFSSVPCSQITPLRHSSINFASTCCFSH